MPRIARDHGRLLASHGHAPVGHGRVRRRGTRRRPARSARSSGSTRTSPPESAPAKVRGYFNDDPCAAGFPAFYHGNPAEQVPIVLQLADPHGLRDDPSARRRSTPRPSASSTTSGPTSTTGRHGRRAACRCSPTPIAARSPWRSAGCSRSASDYSNFEAAGVPIFNMFADILGPHADGSPGFSSEGISILHTPRDNAQTWTAFTSADQAGLTASDGYMTGMEMCANMLRALPARAEHGRHRRSRASTRSPTTRLCPTRRRPASASTFDAGGSQQLASLNPRTFVPDADLQFAWDFGDGSPVAYGKVVRHAYKRVGELQVQADGHQPRHARSSLDGSAHHRARRGARSRGRSGRPGFRPRPAHRRRTGRLPELGTDPRPREAQRQARSRRSRRATRTASPRSRSTRSGARRTSASSASP